MVSTCGTRTACQTPSADSASAATADTARRRGQPSSARPRRRENNDTASPATSETNRKTASRISAPNAQPSAIRTAAGTSGEAMVPKKVRVMR